MTKTRTQLSSIRTAHAHLHSLPQILLEPNMPRPSRYLIVFNHNQELSLHESQLLLDLVSEIHRTGGVAYQAQLSALPRPALPIALIEDGTRASQVLSTCFDSRSSLKRMPHEQGQLSLLAAAIAGPTLTDPHHALLWVGPNPYASRLAPLPYLLRIHNLSDPLHDFLWWMENPDSVEPSADMPQVATSLAPGLNIADPKNSEIVAGLGLSTAERFKKGLIPKDYPLVINNTSFSDMAAAYAALALPFSPSASRTNLPQQHHILDHNASLLFQLCLQKLHQHPDIWDTIAYHGGWRWLAQCSLLTSKPSPWSGSGIQSPLLRAWASAAYVFQYSRAAQPRYLA